MRPHSDFSVILGSILIVIGLSPLPAAPRHPRHSVNLHGGHRHPIADCSDLHIEFDDRDTVVRSEEREDWTVYLLIRAPKSAVIDLDTMNGPISLYDVDGKLTAHAHNGPISLHNFSGHAEISAQNGPISLEGSRGNIGIKTENGP